jgi:ferredoxin-NADP reductase
VGEVRVISVMRCDDLLGVRLSKPPGYSHAAGQWLRLTLGVDDAEDTRTFSIASAPYEDSLEIGTRASGSAYKRALSELQAGDRVDVTAPGGSLRMPEPPSSATFLVGGIGITPIRSILRDAVHGGVDLRGAVLIYGNVDDRCIPYEDELADWQAAGLKVVQVFERPPEGWRGETGFITADVVRRSGPLGDRRFVVTGPPPMVAAMGAVLDQLHVSAGDRRVESFGRGVSAGTGREETP